jgi:hypothetical protein
VSEETSRTAAALVIAAIDNDTEAASALFCDVDVQFAAQVAAHLAAWLVECLDEGVAPAAFRAELAGALRAVPST